jgi:hypothetical protein
VVFAPGPRRIGEVTLEPGATASGAGTGAAETGPDAGGAGAAGSATGAAGILETTSTRRIVTVDLEATKQALARRGGKVAVALPGGENVAGSITEVGKVAERKATAQDEDPPATIEVSIRLERSAGTGLDQAPVDVRLERSRAEDVLSVPVTALLARQGGSFAVEVHEGGKRRVVGVEPGLYTEAYVEIEGDGLRPGQTVTDSGV